MRVSCKVSAVDTMRVLAKAVRANRRAITMMTEAARMDTLPYVPFVTSALARTADTESKPERGLLIYGNAAVPYARSQYYGFPSKTTDAHPQATMEWFEHSKAANRLKWRRIAAQEFRKEF